MRRREFTTLLGGAVAAWPLAARGQQQTMPVVGWLSIGSSNRSADRVRAFLQGLGEAGYVEGRNVAVEYRWANGQLDRLPALATDLVRQQVAVIAANSDPAALAARAATASIPIVFNSGNDPVRLGHVASLNRPSGNMTGVTALNAEMSSKRLQMLKELIPTATTIAVLFNPNSPSYEFQSKEVGDAARTLGLQISGFGANTASEIDDAFEKIAQQRLGGLLISASAFFNLRSEQLAGLSLRYALPSIYQTREFVAAGGLVSYGDHLPDQLRLVGTYTGRILKGESPADLPVQQSTRVELIINLKAAKALGLTVSLPLLGRADNVIE